MEGWTEARPLLQSFASAARARRGISSSVFVGHFPTKTWLPLPLLIDPRNYVKIFPILSRRIDQFVTLGPIFVKTGEKADGSGII